LRSEVRIPAKGGHIGRIVLHHFRYSLIAARAIQTVLSPSGHNRPWRCGPEPSSHNKNRCAGESVRFVRAPGP
jgi:hypothetical protein